MILSSFINCVEPNKPFWIFFSSPIGQEIKKKNITGVQKQSYFYFQQEQMVNNVSDLHCKWGFESIKGLNTRSWTTEGKKKQHRIARLTPWQGVSLLCWKQALLKWSLHIVGNTNARFIKERKIRNRYRHHYLIERDLLCEKWMSIVRKYKHQQYILDCSSNWWVKTTSRASTDGQWPGTSNAGFSILMFTS